jgi:hypothetical protein
MENCEHLIVTPSEETFDWLYQDIKTGRILKYVEDARIFQQYIGSTFNFSCSKYKHLCVGNESIVTTSKNDNKATMFSFVLGNCRVPECEGYERKNGWIPGVHDLIDLILMSLNPETLEKYRELSEKGIEFPVAV